MKASFKLVEPGSADATLTVTMPLGNWIILRDQLQTNDDPPWPSSELIKCLNDVIIKAHTVFWPAPSTADAEDAKRGSEES